MNEPTLKQVLQAVNKLQASHYDEGRHPLGVWHKPQSEIAVVNKKQAHIRSEFNSKDDHLFLNRQTEVKLIQLPNGSTYSGQLKQGKPHGLGTLTSVEAGTRYTGPFVNGLKAGSEGNFQSQQSNYIGTWKNDQMHGQGTLVDQTGRYEGSFLNNLRSGQGIHWFNDGKVFKGLFEDNTYIRGELTLADQTKLDGEWSKGAKFEGAGVIRYINGDVYQGEWANNLPTNGGQMLYRSGKKYTGEWLQGRRHGHGAMVYANSDVYEGEWEQDQRHGYGKLVFNSRSKQEWYEGDWKQDKMHGKGSFRSAQGVQQDGIWEQGYMQTQIRANRLKTELKKITYDIKSTRSTRSLEPLAEQPTQPQQSPYLESSKIVYKPNPLRTAGLHSISTSSLNNQQAPQGDYLSQINTTRPLLRQQSPDLRQDVRTGRASSIYD